MPPVSSPALAMKATPTDTRVTPVRMATASSVREWGWAAGNVADWAVVLVMARGGRNRRGLHHRAARCVNLSALYGFHIA